MQQEEAVLALEALVVRWMGRIPEDARGGRREGTT